MITQDIRRIESASGHILRAVGRAFGKVVSFFLLFGVIGAAAVEGTSYFVNSNVFGTGLTHIAAGAFGVVLGYAAGLTTAVVEAIRALLEATKDAGKEAENVGKTVLGDAEKAGSGAEGLVGGVVKSIGSELGKL
jgi:hypothetical protein